VSARRWQTVVSAPLYWMVGTTSYGYAGPNRLQYVHKFGYTTGITTGGYQAIWPGGTTYTFASAPFTAEIVSASSNDDATSTGARTATVYGLGADYSTRQETVTLTGTTPTTLTSTGWLRVNQVTVDTAGSRGSNIGKLSVRPAGGGTTYGIVSAGSNQTVQAVYTVPAGHRGYLLSESISAQRPVQGSNKTASGTFKLLARTSTGGVFRVQQEHPIEHNHDHHYDIPIPYPAKTDLVFNVRAYSSDVDSGVEFNMLLEAL
jgi:hypothetical protein